MTRVSLPIIRVRDQITVVCIPITKSSQYNHHQGFKTYHHVQCTYHQGLCAHYLGQ